MATARLGRCQSDRMGRITKTSASRKRYAHALQGHPVRRDRDTLPRLSIRDQHGAGYGAADRKRDLGRGRGTRGVALGIEVALFPAAGKSPAAIAQLAPDLDLVAVARAADGEAKLGSAAGIVGAALDALPLSFIELDLAGAAPGAKERIERARISVGRYCRREHCKRRDSDAHGKRQ